MIVRFTVPGLASLREKRLWWELHRDRNPRLFMSELAAVVRKIRTGADQERHPCVTSDGERAWRLSMRKTRAYVYYWYIADHVAEILLIDNAVAGEPPAL